MIVEWLQPMLKSLIFLRKSIGFSPGGTPLRSCARLFQVKMCALGVISGEDYVILGAFKTKIR